jgi:hypothetical protein
MTQLDLIGPPADPRDKGLLAFCRLHQLPPILSDTFEAGDAWGANCGPMALAAVLGLPTVGAVREFVRPFHGFMNPTHMRTALDRAGARHSDVDPPLRNLGLVRIQWVGSWCDSGVDPRAAYRYTHWIGTRGGGDACEVYDATPNRWVPMSEWARWCPSLYPKRATGWHIANVIEVAP